MNAKDQNIKQVMADIKMINQAIAEIAVEAAKALILAICIEDRRKNVNTEQASTSEVTRHRKGPSLRQPVFP